MSDVEYERVTKRFGDGTVALSSLDLSIHKGELMVFVGPSGCGKTTALRMLAGLEEVTDGEIRIGGKAVNHVEASDRDIAMVFQNYALYPHMTVAANMVFPLKMRGVPRAERETRVRSVAGTLGLMKLLDRRPSQLSGGQRQRVAIGRALIREPRVFLMDEPLSNLDAKLRQQMRVELAEIQQRLGITTIYVTHDQVEAMTLGSRVAVLRHGRLQQEAAPDTLYAAPANMFVAAFIGSPPMNLVEGEIAGGPDATVRVGETVIALDPDEARDAAEASDRAVVVGIRPERMALAAGDVPADGRTLAGTVRYRESFGSDVMVQMALPASRPLRADLFALAHDVEDSAELDGPETKADAAILQVRLPAGAPVMVGAPLRVTLAPGSVVLFDPKTGERIAADRSEGGAGAGQTAP